MKFDDILGYIGEFGPYQKRIFFLTCLPAVLTAFMTLSPVFLLYTPPHRCAIPGLDNDTYKIQSEHHQLLVNNTIPIINGEYSKCEIYTNDSATGTTSNSSVTQCSRWVFDHYIFTSTITEHVRLVCKNKIFRSHSNMVLMAGKLFGSIAQSVTSDLFGRRMSFLFFLLCMIVFGFANYAINDFASLIILRFLTGASTTSVYIAGFVIGMELVAPRKRLYVGMFPNFFWVSGGLLLCGAAYFIRDWQILVIVLSSPAVLCLSYWWLIPESPRWLLTKGRVLDAEKIIKKAAEVNKATLPDKAFTDKTLDDDNAAPKGKLSELFTNRTLAIRSLAICFLWAAASFTFYGLNLNVSNLSGDVIFNFFLSSVVELGGYILAFLILDRVGRKFLQCSSYMLGGVACISAIFPVLFAKESAYWALVMLSLIGKMGSSIAFATIYIFTAELYPTPIRNTGMGVSSVCSRIGGIVAPYVADLSLYVDGKFGDALPLLVFGIVAVLAGLSALVLPETLNRNLPETIADAKEFAKQKPVSAASRREEEKKKQNGVINGAFHVSSEDKQTRL